MATISTRINSSGTYFVNGTFDEVTYNRTSPVIKNLLISTEDFSQWANVGHVITTNQAIAPDGSLTADRIQATTGSGGDYTAILNNSSVGGASYTFSFWVKSVSGVTGTWGVNYYNGAHNRTTVPITGEWARQYITFTGTGGQFNVYIADNRTSLATITDAYVWGAQLERGTTPTIYQGITASGTLITPTFVNRTTTNTYYVTNVFDEVTYNAVPGFVKRETSDGSLYVSDKFDEVSGMIVTNGLVLQLDPGKPESFITSGTSLTDISSNTRNCTLVGAITYDSTSSSLLFDTTATTVNNRISLLSSTGIDNTVLFADGNEYTIEFWCKIASDALETFHSIAGRGSTNPWLGIQKNASSYNLFFRQIGGTYFYSTTINASVFTGWTQVVFSVDANRVVRYYVNHAAGTFTDSDNVTTSTFTINRLAAGYTSGGNYYAFDGNVGPINIYNKVLSAAEVNNNFEALRDRFGI